MLRAGAVGFGARRGSSKEADAKSAFLLSVSFVRGRKTVYRDIPEELRTLIEPVVQDLGLELVDIEQTRAPGAWALCITVDTPEGDGRVTIGRCAEVSRELGTHLDAADLIPTNYRLEVSSPGLDRHLGREKDFLAARGHEVRIETRRPLDGRRRYRGRLLDFANGVARVAVDGTEFAIPFEEIARANTVYAFTRADFRRQG
jgi:ribosome maturation factor RimP